MAEIVSLVPDDDEIRALLRRWVELQRTATAASDGGDEDEWERLLDLAFDIENRIALAKPSPVALAIKAFLFFRLDLFCGWSPDPAALGPPSDRQSEGSWLPPSSDIGLAAAMLRDAAEILPELAPLVAPVLAVAPRALRRPDMGRPGA